MLIVFPLGLLAMSFVFDIIYLASDNGGSYAAASYYMIAAGLLTGVAAAVAGTLDWRGIPKGTRASRIGLIHGIGNAVLLVLFLVSWLIRRSVGYADPGVAPIVVSFLGVALSMATAWLGGELVYRLNIGPDTGANADAPSSLLTDNAYGTPAGETERVGEPAHRTSFPGR
jgi:uncharacterized membrane protein